MQYIYMLLQLRALIFANFIMKKYYLYERALKGGYNKSWSGGKVKFFEKGDLQKKSKRSLINNIALVINLAHLETSNALFDFLRSVTHDSHDTFRISCKLVGGYFFDENLPLYIKLLAFDSKIGPGLSFLPLLRRVTYEF